MKGGGGLIVLLLAMVIVGFLYFGRVGQKKSYIETTLDANERIRTELTKVNLSTLERAIQFATSADGELPADLNAVFASRMFTGDPSDGWGTRIKYERKPEAGFRLIAAGKDRAFGTADDIVVER
jgi:hypothetical protein